MRIAKALRSLEKAIDHVFLAVIKIMSEPFLLWRKSSAQFESIQGYRYPNYLMHAMLLRGTIVVPFRDLRQARNALHPIDLIMNVRMTTTGANGDTVYFCEEGTADVLGKCLRINEDYFSRNRNDAAIVAPHFAHPTYYKLNLHRRCKVMRDEKRSKRIFFAGTHALGYYSNWFDFPIINRDRIIAHVLSNYDVTDFRESRSGAIVFSLVSDNGANLRKHPMEPEEFLVELSRADFFLCPPGWRMPHSHNLTEAMSVGTIPILNYAQYIHPSLEDGRNCLCFDTLDELDSIIARVLAMPSDEVAVLRAGVIDYYDRHLDPASFGATLAAKAHEANVLYVNASLKGSVH